MLLDSGGFNLEQCTIFDNTSNGIHVTSYYASIALLVDGCSVTGNLNGCAIYRTGSGGTVATLVGSSFSANTSFGFFYGYDMSVPEMQSTTITGNGRSVRLPLSQLPGPTAG